MQEVDGSTPTWDTCSNDFFPSNRPRYPHPVSSELENSGIRVAVGDCSVTERLNFVAQGPGKPDIGISEVAEIRRGKTGHATIGPLFTLFYFLGDFLDR